MDNLRELDYKLAKLRGWRHIERDLWLLPGDNVRVGTPPHWHKDPVACAELDREMEKRGYWLTLSRIHNVFAATYYYPCAGNMNVFNTCYSTETEARTRAAIAALEKTKGEGNA